MWSEEFSPWHFVHKMSVELTGGEIGLIQTGLDCQIEVFNKLLQSLVDGSEKQKGYQKLVWIYNRLKMKFLNYATLYHFVNNSYGLATILAIAAQGTDRIPENAIPDTEIADKTGLSLEEVYHYLRQLVSLGLVEIDQYVKGVEYRMIRITKEGLDASSENQDLLR